MSDVGTLCTPKICRLCLAQTATCFSLVEDTEASGMLEALTSLRILPTDEISTIMCLKCRLNLKLAFTIQQNMLKAEKKFRDQQLPVRIKQEPDETIPEFEHIEIDETIELPEDRNHVLRQLLKEATSQTHSCEICGLSKSTKRNLKLHYYNVHRTRKCPECDKDIKLNKFKEHSESHKKTAADGTVSFTCQICGTAKASKTLLRHHHYNVHVTKKCPQCGEEVKLGKFREHLDGHDENVKHTCDLCGIEKSSKRNLSHHKYNVHMTKKCPKCEKIVKLTKFKHHVDGHKLSEEKVLEKKASPNDESRVVESESRVVENASSVKSRIYSCNICSSVKTSKRNLQHHIYSVHKCRRCGICKQIVKLADCRSHLEKHSSEMGEESNGMKKLINRSYPCDSCQVVKDSQAALDIHRYKLHMEGKCPICGKQIKQINIQRHIERHKNIQTVCELCGTTMNSHDLNSHMHYAHKQRSFKCQNCDKVYKKKQSLLAHEKREHLKKADFVCETCGKCFHARLHLKKHIDGTHLKLRPYVCEFCKVGFSSRFALRTHRRQHTNETPYKCEFCSEGFRQKVSLRAHLKSKHDVQEELTCACPTCGKKFASSAALIAHNRIHL